MQRMPDPDDPSYSIPAYWAARRVLFLFWDSKLPIRPWEFARALGVTLRPRGGPGDADYTSCGAYIVEGGKHIIEYNVRHDSMRIRFTIAHELGHFMFGHTNAPSDVRGFHVDDPDIRERIANRFALDLLVPKEVLRGMVRMCKLRSIEAMVDAFQLPAGPLVDRLLQTDFGY